MFWINLRREHQRWTQQTHQAQQWLANDGALIAEAAPHVSGWSPAQHLHHVADINRRVLDQLLSDRASASDDTEAGRLNLAGYVLLTLGRLPRGRGQSPRAFRPPDTVDPDALKERVRANRAQLDQLADRLDTLQQVDWRAPHPVLGDLDPSEWLRFARIHTGHHHRIIRDIMAEHR